jgi:hypothetical protein
MRRFLAASCAAFVLLPAALQAQARPAAVNVFLDCNTHGCDSEHFRNEIEFVNWVRDRTVADVHLLITGEMSGSGMVHQLAFIGLRTFAGDSMRSSAAISSVMTQSEARDVLTNRIAQGLLHYASRTEAGDRIRITYETDDEEGPTRGAVPLNDPWNFWVFSMNLNGSTDGEARDKSRDLELSANARRTTEDWKTEIGLEGSYEENVFELTDRTITRVRRNWQASAGAAKSLARLWSAGAMVEAGRSTFQNQDFYTRVATVLEYSFFPYEQFSRRQVTLQYSLGSRYSDYTEVTIFDRTSENRLDQSLELSADFQQRWGSSNVSLSGSHYLHDLSRYNLSVDGGIDVRLFKGFSLNLEGDYSRVRDQLYIPKGDADDEEILLELQQLQTNYRYDFSVGLRYTFGSLYNNIVNPRLN